MSYSCLSEIVMNTIDFFKSQHTLPVINIPQEKIPLVVGSGNGYFTGRILFRNNPAFFASEAEVEQKLKNIESITDVVVISASGEKHAPIILETAKKYNKNTLLISSKPNSSGSKIADTTVIFPKITEPYTYNTSTYFGYLFGENPELNLDALKDFIYTGIEKNICNISWMDFNGFCIVLPDEFVLLREMVEVKFIELFGRKIARDVFTYEGMRHATTVVESETELFICFGNTQGKTYGKNQINLPIFDSKSYAAMMLMSYFLVGEIQRAFPPYFMNSIDIYCERAEKQIGFKIAPIVPA